MQNLDWQAIKAAVDLREVAQQYVVLKRRGREWVGPCPICRAGDDRFWIRADGQAWGCRKCDTGGDVINLVAKVEGITNGQAAQQLTGSSTLPARAKITPTKAPEKPDLAWQSDDWQKDAHGQIEAAERARRDDAGQVCRDYLDRRGILAVTADAFKLGFDPARFDPVSKTNRPALLIPWVDGTGTVTAIKYRFIDDQAAEDKTRRFTQKAKSQAILFGLNLATGGGADRLLVAVEGELNAATIHQATRAEGCDVVSLGAKRNDAGITALDQLITRQKYSRVLLWLDDAEDSAAAGAKLKDHRPLLMKSPHGHDANDINRAYGPNVLRDLIFQRLMPDSSGLDPSDDTKHGDAPKPFANGHQWPGMTYTADMGEILLDRQTSVMIAGRVRRNLVWLRPDLVRIYESADRTCPNGYGT